MLNTRLSAIPISALARLSPRSVAGHLRRLWVDYTRRRATLGTLSRLDDRMLADIGLSRTDLALLRHQSDWAPSDEAVLYLNRARRRASLRSGRS